MALALILTAALPLAVTAAPITLGHSWGGSAMEIATAVVADGGGNVTLAGLQQSPFSSWFQLFVARFGPNGQFQWNRLFPYLQGGNVRIALAPGGGVYVLGNTSTPAQPLNATSNLTIPSAFVARLSATGSLVFAENFTQIPLPGVIAADPSTGGFVVAGNRNSPFNASSFGQVIVAAFDAAGALRWARSTPGTTGTPVAVAADATGRVYVLMDRLNGNAGLAGFDANGNLTAQAIIGSFCSPMCVSPTALTMTASGPLVAAYQGGAVFLSQLTPSLGVAWSTTAEGNGWGDYPEALVALSDGSFALLTQSYSLFNSTLASNVYHFTSTGSVVSGSSYVSPAESQGLGAGFFVGSGAALSNAGLVLAGWTLGVSPQTSTSVTVGESAPIVAWSPDVVSWSSFGVTPTVLVPLLGDPSVPVDNWNEIAGQQAWYGETNLPASKVTVTVLSSHPSPSSATVSFTTTVSGGRKPFAYNWSFGDGSFASGSGSPTHTYPGTGQYLAQVTVRDSAGLVGYGSAVVTVTGPPVILFLGTSSNGTVYAGNYVGFFTNALDPDGGFISTYQWSFGDGFVDTTSFSSDFHVYATPGNYTMTLTVTDSDQGLIASASLAITVLPRPDFPPVASFFWSPFQPTAGSQTVFYGYQSFDPDGFIVSWQWDFGDGSTVSTNGSVVGHTYTAAGTYTVTLVVTDNAGLTGNMSAPVTVVPDLPPVADFVWQPQVPSVNQTVFFNGAYVCTFFCTQLSYDPDGYIVSWNWSFGDGTTSGGNGTGNVSSGTPFPNHAYATFGNFVVTLTVTDNAGLTASASKTLYVNAVPTASFTTSEPVGKVGTAIRFNASASRDPDHDPLNYSWSFGDGSTARGIVVSHIFAVPGQYFVTLVVSDPYSSAFASMYLPVIPPKSPTAVIAWSPPVPVAGQTTVRFNGSNSFDPDGPIVRYIWEFGDGTVGSGITATHVYATAGTYTPELIVVDEDGLSSRDTQTLTVVAPSKGNVVAASAQLPIAGAQVDLTRNGAVVLSVVTDTGGAFSLGGLLPGAYAITIAKEGFLTYTGTLVWDGIHGALGTFALVSIGSSGTASDFLFGSSIGLALLVGAAVATGVAGYAVRRRRRRAARPRDDRGPSR